MLRLIVGVMAELVALLKGEDKSPQVIAGDVLDVLVSAQELAEVADA